MEKYQEITEARKLLGIPEQATMKEIQSRYRALLTEHHPDKNSENEEQCKEKTQEIIAAYELISGYCHRYRYSFTKDEIKNQFPDDNWWFERFGSDPIWSSD
jgi:DnaJ-class molecular chaperone